MLFKELLDSILFDNLSLQAKDEIIYLTLKQIGFTKEINDMDGIFSDEPGDEFYLQGHLSINIVLNTSGKMREIDQRLRAQLKLMPFINIDANHIEPSYIDFIYSVDRQDLERSMENVRCDLHKLISIVENFRPSVETYTLEKLGETA